MNILVIGNGFDLAHELPTKYTDFLEFCKVIARTYFVDNNDSANLEENWNRLNIIKNIKLKSLFEKLNNIRVVEEFKPSQDELSYHVSTNTVYDEFYEYVKNNFWIDYFLNNPVYQKENWIDFESEISRMIQSVDNDMDSNITLEDKIKSLTNDYLKKRYIDWFANKTYKELRNVLLYDLNKLNRALEIYLMEYVEKIEIQKKSPDIDELEIEHVLSFNYTDTYEKVYGISKEIEYDYIHGKADINNTIETNNMVLGIDEYLPEYKRNKDVEFVAFKKYYQRIYKQTGCKYKEWTDGIYNNYMNYINNQKKLSEQSINGVCTIQSFRFSDMKSGEQVIVSNPSKYEKHNLYIFGHSLDISDRDILRDLILNDNVYTTVYYPNKEELGKKITNLVKVIGQDELIRRTGGNTKTIEFRQQQDMVEINS